MRRHAIKRCLIGALSGLLLTSVGQGLLPNTHASEITKHSNLEKFFPEYHYQSKDFGKLLQDQFGYYSYVEDRSNDNPFSNGLMYRQTYKFPSNSRYVDASHDIFGFTLFSTKIDKVKRNYNNYIKYRLTPHHLIIYKYTQYVGHRQLSRAFGEHIPFNRVVSSDTPMGVTSVTYRLGKCDNKNGQQLIFYPIKFRNYFGHIVKIRKSKQNKYPLVMDERTKINNEPYHTRAYYNRGPKIVHHKVHHDGELPDSGM